ncbi:hypothetical protein DVS28_b0286 (plasmid) [Euzebya pacifica]|uniref:Uncharacterized protein n=1 Tax=Euzebya pacifica TaxID=1608957 RepID=A0A346Y6F9_9ACTN|nr:hypothetical protein [Euzebya pacifica]AXV10056.1 hypothetical protein DVS28_b0286 [Euzebya pacifica]
MVLQHPTEAARRPRLQAGEDHAQSDNGGWLQHSWGIDRSDGTIVETAVPRSRYFGVVLTDEEAAEFRFWNASGSASASRVAPGHAGCVRCRRYL